MANVSLFIPADMNLLDNKLDDGKPTSGKFKSGAGLNANGNCTNPPNSPWTNAVYELSNHAVACYLFFAWED